MLVLASAALLTVAGCIPDLKQGDGDKPKQAAGAAGQTNSRKSDTNAGGGRVGSQPGSGGGTSAGASASGGRTEGNTTSDGNGSGTQVAGGGSGATPPSASGGDVAITTTPTVGTGGTSSATTVLPVAGGSPNTTTTNIATATSGCSSGSRTCTNGVPQLCSNNQWQPQTACGGETPTCQDGRCICTPGTLRCAADGREVQQSCSESGVWQDQKTCNGATAYCNGAGECGACKDASKKCNANTPQVCSAGVWTNQLACGGTTPYCNGAGVCGACSTGTRMCSGNTPQLCSSAGQWDDQPLCSGTKPVCVGQGVCGCPSGGGPTMVGLPLGYCVDSTEVTQGQYAAWLKTNPSTGGQISDCSWNTTFEPSVDWSTWATETPTEPMGVADWCDAYAYCKAVGKRMCGRINGGSLASDAFASAAHSQWYAACSSNGANTYVYGNTYSSSACASAAGCQSTVAGYAGIFGMSSGVSEWEDSCDGSGASAVCRLRDLGFGSGEDATCGYDRTGSRDTGSTGWPYYGIRCCAP